MVTAYNNTAIIYNIILFLVIFLQISDTIERFPTASGLVVAFTNKICPRAEHELPNIETSAREISSAFHNLGYVSCIFHECVKAKCVAVFKALSERIDFPSSYKMLFTYFAGHGKMYRRAYLMNEEGKGVGTSEFLNALCTRNNCSFTVN